MLFLLFTKQKGPRRGAARKTSGECGQRFISLTGPVALCSRMMRSISLKSEEGRSPGTVFLTLDVAVNLLFLFGILASLGAVLTLPGIAGIVLTLGMAVDANVLIYERIREEIRAGHGVQQAIHMGYERAFATIADSNITTLITALILFAVGTGPVRGFALVLMIGILCSMFTAITGSRAIVNLCWGGRKIKDLSI